MSGTRPPVDYIERTREQYAALGYPPYRWATNTDAPPWVPLRKPLAECRIGLIASGGIYVAGQVAFHFKDDTSFRVVDMETPTGDLRATHFAYDLTDARSDPNVVFPIDTLRVLATERVISAVSRNAYTFMGGIYSSRKVRDLLAPAIAERIVNDEVDLALLVPV
ncbi:MAG TPA: glycine/sarcosine/betaine reductase selenoprotein B family protein [Candidatus Binatia bacterium]|nr:glycine/sarcosine/betaine reductase selenoprotein B family protein [Candidatus Binatia bacterium]